MKIRFLLLLIIFMSAFNVFGEKKEQDAKKEKKVHFILEKKSNNLKPLSAMWGEELLNVDCYWEEGTIEIDFSEPEGMGVISFHEISETELERMAINTLHPIIINIGYPTEPILIRIQTSIGNKYEGILML